MTVFTAGYAATAGVTTDIPSAVDPLSRTDDLNRQLNGSTMQAASADRPATTPDIIFSHSDGEVLTLDVYQPARYLEKAIGGSLDFVARTLGAS